MKSFIAAVLALCCAVSLSACSSRGRGSSSSSSSSLASSSEPLVSSSAPSSSSSSSMRSSSEGVLSDLEDAASHAMSDVESAVSPTMSTDLNKIGALSSKPVKWGSGLHQDENGRTTDTVALQEIYKDLGAYFIAPEDCGKFYLTFDEGYENGHTAKILDILKEKQVSAVFFVTLPYVKESPDLIRRMIDEGHIIGNHTNRHLIPTDIPIERAKQDIQELHDYMLENYQYEMYLYRPPTGIFSEQLLAMVQQMGYSTVLWSFGYSDWDPKNQPSYDTALAHTEKFIHEGAIFLLHAVSQTNTELLPVLIDEIRSRGLEIAKWDLPYVAPK